MYRAITRPSARLAAAVEVAEVAAEGVVAEAVVAAQQPTV